MGMPGFPEALRVLCHDAGGDLRQVLAAACEPVPASDPVVYLADFAHMVLFPLAAGVGRGAGGGDDGGPGRSPPASRLPAPGTARSSGVGAGGGTDHPGPGCWRSPFPRS